MSPRPGEPLLKCTLNLFHSDVIKLRSRYGQGWTTQVREWVHNHCREARPITVAEAFATHEELSDE